MLQHLLSVAQISLVMTCNSCSSIALPALGTELALAKNQQQTLSITNKVLENVMATFNKVIDKVDPQDLVTAACESVENPVTKAFNAVTQTNVPNFT